MVHLVSVGGLRAHSHCATALFQPRRSVPVQPLSGGMERGTLELNSAGGPNTSVLVLSGAAKRDAATKRKPHVPSRSA